MRNIYTPAEFALARSRLPMGQIAFAQFIGVSRSTLTRWEGGHAPIPQGFQQLLWLLSHVEGAVDLVRTQISSPESPPRIPTRPAPPSGRGSKPLPQKINGISTPGGVTTYVEQRPDGGKVEIVKFPHKDRDWMPPGMSDNSLPDQK